jgi:hypothetical protein
MYIASVETQLFRNASALQQPEHFVASPERRKKKDP